MKKENQPKIPLQLLVAISGNLERDVVKKQLNMILPDPEGDRLAQIKRQHIEGIIDLTTGGVDTDALNKSLRQAEQRFISIGLSPVEAIGNIVTLREQAVEGGLLDRISAIVALSEVHADKRFSQGHRHGYYTKP